MLLQDNCSILYQNSKPPKQSLQLGKCQSQNFDAQIADTTITFIQYQFLAISNQLDKYKSMGELMRNTKAERLERKLHQRLIALLLNIAEHLSYLFEDFAFIILRRMN